MNTLFALLVLFVAYTAVMEPQKIGRWYADLTAAASASGCTP